MTRRARARAAERPVAVDAPGDPILRAPGQPRAAWLASLGHGVNDAYTAMIPALLPLLQARFGLTESLLALLVFAFTASSSLPGPFLGWLADRVGHRATTALSVAFSAVFLSLIGAASSLGALFALALMAGLGSAALHPAGSTLARRGHGNADLAVALFSAGGMVGYAVGPVAILAFVGAFGLEATPWLLLPGLALAGALYLALPEGAQAPPSSRPGARFDRGLLSGPVGALTVVGALAFLPFLAFTSAIPLWLVETRGVAPDEALIGWTLTAFSLAAGAGGVLAGLLSLRVRREVLVPAVMLLALLPLSAVFVAEPGSPGFLLTALAGGALTYAGVPLLVVTAQDLAPRSAAAAAGMLLGLSSALAGLLYLGVGWLQETIGIGPAVLVAYLGLVPAAALARRTLASHSVPRAPAERSAAERIACACLACACPGSGPLGQVPPASTPLSQQGA